MGVIDVQSRGVTTGFSSRDLQLIRSIIFSLSLAICKIQNQVRLRITWGKQSSEIVLHHINAYNFDFINTTKQFF